MLHSCPGFAIRPTSTAMPLPSALATQADLSPQPLLVDLLLHCSVSGDAQSHIEMLCRRKLLKAFHNEKKQQFDISKVPDIYDSAKYDAIHNSELGRNMKQLYTVGCHIRELT